MYPPSRYSRNSYGPVVAGIVTVHVVDVTPDPTDCQTTYPESPDDAGASASHAAGPPRPPVNVTVTCVPCAADVALAFSTGAGTMSSDTRLLGPPPGDGVKTLSCAVPTDATSKDGTLIRSCVALTYVVVRLTPFHRATDDETKPLPLSVSVIGTPATAGAGVSDVRVGTGCGACATVIDGLVA